MHACHLNRALVWSYTTIFQCPQIIRRRLVSGCSAGATSPCLSFFTHWQSAPWTAPLSPLLHWITIQEACFPHQAHPHTSSWESVSALNSFHSVLVLELTQLSPKLKCWSVYQSHSFISHINQQKSPWKAQLVKSVSNSWRLPVGFALQKKQHPAKSHDKLGPSTQLLLKPVGGKANIYFPCKTVFTVVWFYL